MAQGANDKVALMVFDTLGTPEGAVLAARAARKAKAAIILGPVFAREVPGVLAAVGGVVPVVSFSNDAALVDSGAFLFGITARQSVLAVLRYAQGRGVRRVAVASGAPGWGSQALNAALAAGPGLGLEVVQLPVGGIAALGTVAAEQLPDAVLLTDAADLARSAAPAAALGVQVLGAVQALDLAPETLRAIDGAWLAALDPLGFAGFARAFEDRNGARPGTIAGLAYDAAAIVRQMRLGGGIDRSALLSAGGFKGVCGDVRFREDGSVARALAVLAVTNGQFRKVASGVMA